MEDLTMMHEKMLKTLKNASIQKMH